MTVLTSVGTEVSVDTYRCTTCGYTIDTRWTTLLRTCLSCGGPNEWEAITPGESTDPPRPDPV